MASETNSFASTLACAKSPKLPTTSVNTEAVIQFVVRPACLILPVVIFLTLSSLTLGVVTATIRVVINLSVGIGNTQTVPRSFDPSKSLLLL